MSGPRLADVRSEIGISPALVCSSAHSSNNAAVPLEEENESLVATLCCTHSILAWSVATENTYGQYFFLYVFPAPVSGGVRRAEGERGKENGIENCPRGGEKGRRKNKEGANG